jgi:CBS-domain-containing membrane protein
MESDADPRLRSIWLALVASTSVGLSAAVFYVGFHPSFALLFFPVIAFAVLVFAVRWLVVRHATINALGGKLLLVIGGVKIALLLALVLLALECVIGALIHPSARPEMLETFVTGMVAFAVLSIGLTGVVNGLMIVRKLLKY